MRPDIFRLMSYANEKGVIVALATNGTLIDQDLAKRVKREPSRSGEHLFRRGG